MCRIVTYNIHSGVGNDKKQDYRRIGNFLAENGADIVLLQEMDTRPENRELEQDIKDICADKVFVLAPSPALNEQNGWYGNAVLSRYPIISNETLDVSQDGFQPRNIQTVVVQTHKGPLTVINTHKGLKKRERRSQFALLHEYIEERMKLLPSPLVLGGDFNEWQFFTSAFKALNNILRPTHVGATFPSKFPLFSLDRIWTTRDIVVHKCKRIKNGKTKLFSDHLPIQLDMQLPKQ
ncbi:endonuclease/exonuclease/phosphatase family protein [Alteromonas sp. ASW11-130]|uniref:endonuclease/exonuclease/phosphatase family protein n=1 Tax=Alteromonas sp. ASW11-130 TaxID=3015775 RepID=UPI0022423608|nr:endonuclease/exonuclease/phosphatase family protein [Alteromonas sp. ASW11-130]MCW8092982.1 endonuclease/exonuclease/phosphatase family protein [Alteromonas sp. ASW11-130]